MSRKYIVILFCLILTGCNIVSIGNGSAETPDNPVAEVIPEEIIIRGNNLENLGLTIDLNSLNPFTDPSSNIIRPYDLTHYDYSELLPLTGIKFSVLGIQYARDISLESMNILYIQGFEKPEKYKILLFEIGRKTYTSSDLAQYKIYEDCEYIVFEVRDLLPNIVSFDEAIEKEIKYQPSLDWIVDVYKYLRDYNNITVMRI